MDDKTRTKFRPYQALPDKHAQFEAGRKAGLMGLFIITALATVALVATVAPLVATHLVPLLPMCITYNEMMAYSIALNFFVLPAVVGTMISWAANVGFWLAMQPRNTKGRMTGFLGGMGRVANAFGLPPRLEA